jgi:integrase
MPLLERKKPQNIGTYRFRLLPRFSGCIKTSLLTDCLPTTETQMRTKLTPSFIKTAPKPDKGDRVIYWDDRQPGFGLMVTSTGARSFVFQYRNAHQVSRRWTWDVALPLLIARREARKMAGRVAEGKDPVAERRVEREGSREAATNTLKAIAESYFATEREKPVKDRLRSLNKKHQTFKRNIYPHIGAKPIGEIRKSAINRMLDKLAKESGPSAADQALTQLTGLLTWHSKRDDHFRNPIGRGSIDRRRTRGDRDRILSDDELRVVWRTAEAPGVLNSYVRFLLLTAVRRKEASGMRWDEVANDDLWTVPKERMKGKAGKAFEHGVPLSRPARAILDGMLKIGPFVFTNDGKKPIAGFSHAKDKFDADVLATLRKEDTKAKPLPHWTLHDLRRTARSLMSRAGIQPDIAERVLAHKIGGVRGVYDRYAYLDEKRHAIKELAAQIERIVNPLADNVVPLRTKEISQVPG